MSFGIAILLYEKKLPTESYLSFVNAYTLIFGQWDIDELAPLNLNADETVHDFTILTGTTEETRERVWVTLERREFMKKYGRGRRKIFWQIYTETKVGRGPHSLALQLLIPLQAFSFFVDPVVLVEFVPEKVFLERNNYETFVKRGNRTCLRRRLSKQSCAGWALRRTIVGPERRECVPQPD